MEIRAEIKHIIKNSDKATKAFADVVIDDSIVIHSVGVVEKDTGRYITMPRSKWTNKQGEVISRDITHPITTACRELIQSAVLAAYDKALAENADSDFEVAE